MLVNVSEFMLSCYGEHKAYEKYLKKTCQGLTPRQIYNKQYKYDKQYKYNKYIINNIY